MFSFRNKKPKRYLGIISEMPIAKGQYKVCPLCGKVYPHNEDYNFCPYEEETTPLRTMKIE